MTDTNPRVAIPPGHIFETGLPDWPDSDRDLLAKALEYLHDHWDVGPPGEGWQSDKLLVLIATIEERLSVETPQRFDGTGRNVP